MRQPVVPLRLLALALGFAVLAAAHAPSAIAHADHNAACSEASLKAMRADLQAMNDGAPKEAATKEMAIANEMLAKNDVKACAEHMSKAEEEMEK